MEEYQALFVYVGLRFVIFVGGLVWGKYRKAIVRRLNLAQYRHHDGRPDQNPA
jgi:hypothetical protein